VLSARIKRNDWRFASVPFRQNALEATGGQVVSYVDFRFQHDAEAGQRPSVGDIAVIDPQSCGRSKACTARSTKFGRIPGPCPRTCGLQEGNR
jgi:hypothetical protein